MSDILREVPKHFLGKQRTWFAVAALYYFLHFIFGVTSAALSTLVAANASFHILSPTWTALCSAGAAMCAIALTITRAPLVARNNELAARELEKANSLYRADPAVPVKALSDAEVRGIDILSDKSR